MCLRWVRMCLRLCWGWTLIVPPNTPPDSTKRTPMSEDPSVISRRLAEMQHEWLRGARARLFRLGGIPRRRQLLEVGAGHGFAAHELSCRSVGHVTAVDRSEAMIHAMQAVASPQLKPVQANVNRLPFPDCHFDLVFSQFSFVWFPRETALREILRVLRRDGVFLAIEPDYAAMIEHPHDLARRDHWVHSIQSAGGCADMGRRLAVELRSHGMDVDILLPDRLVDASPLADEFLPALTSTDAQPTDAPLPTFHPPELLHLPLFMLHATKRPARSGPRFFR